MQNIVIETKDLTTHYPNQRADKELPLGFLVIENQSDEKIEVLVRGRGKLVLKGEKVNPLLFSLEKFNQGQTNISTVALPQQTISIYTTSLLSPDNQKRAKETAKEIRKGLKKEIMLSIRARIINFLFGFFRIINFLFGFFRIEVGIFRGCIIVKSQDQILKEIPVKIGFCI